MNNGFDCLKCRLGFRLPAASAFYIFQLAPVTGIFALGEPMTEEVAVISDMLTSHHVAYFFLPYRFIVTFT
jgi:hypothetical protein